MPAPPMPANQSLRPSSGEGNELLGDLIGSVRARESAHRRRHLPEQARIGQERADERRDAVAVRLGDDDGAAAVLEEARVLRLMLASRELARHEDGGLAQDVSAQRAAEDEQDGPGRRQPEDAPALLARRRPRARRNRPAGDAVLRAIAALDRKREEDAPRERYRQPVGEP